MQTTTRLRTLPIASPYLDQQAGDREIRSWQFLGRFDFICAAFVFPSALGGAGGPVGIESPAGSRYKGATVPRASPTHTHTSNQPPAMQPGKFTGRRCLASQLLQVS